MSDNYDEEYPPVKGGVRKLLLFIGAIVGFFMFLAVAVPKVRAAGGSTDQMFFTIIEGLIAAVIIPLILNAILKRMGLKGKKPHELAQMFIGYQSPYPIPGEEFSVPSDGWEWGQTGTAPATTPRSNQEIVPYGSTNNVAPYQQDEEYADEDDERYVDEDEEDEDIEELIEQDGLYLAENFLPDPRSLTCQNVTFVGVRRSGKSNALAILLKRLAALEFPIVIFDTEDEYEELARKRHMPRGVLVGSEEGRADAPADIRFFAIDQATAYNFGQFLLEECLQAVVNMKDWSDNDAAEIMSEMILGMEDWQQNRSKRLPFYIVVDEITKWVPQNQGENTLSKDARTMVQHALFDVTVRRGGKRGFGLIVAGQKYADIDKRILQGIWKIIFCQTEPNDLDRCKGSPLNLDPDEVSSLQPGESFVFCPQRPRGIYVKWPLSDVKLGGKSPGIENLREHHQTMSRSVTGVLTKAELEQRMRRTEAPARPLARRQEDGRAAASPREDERDVDDGKVTYLHPSQQPQPNTDRQLAWGCAVMHYLNEILEPYTATAVRRPRKELREMALALQVIKADAEEIIGGGARAKQIHEEVVKLPGPRMLELLRLATQAQAAYQTSSSELDRRAESQ